MKWKPLPKKKYSIIYADPPWDYKGHLQHTKTQHSKGARYHYDTVTLDDLKTLPVESICRKNCLLFIWATSPHLDQAIELMRAWGFAYKTVAFVWKKDKVNPGYYTLSQCELCLVGKRGKIPLTRGSRCERQLVIRRRREHSEKPNVVRHRIEKMFPKLKRIELFARSKQFGWDVWGEEV